MKYSLYASLLFISFLSVNSISQELDTAFLSSLPQDVATDLINRSNKRNALEQPQYRRPSTFIDKPEPTSDRFGAQIFSMMQSSLMPVNEPNFDSSYVLDFGDQLQIQLIGQKSNIDKIMINRDGSINITDIGKLFVGGLTLKDASNLIKSKINQSFIGVDAFVTLINVRDVQIIMAGNVFNPGSYTLNGNSNIFHALSVSGGPSENGSFRLIDLIRDSKKIETIDLYETFIFGKPSFNTRLRSGDIVFVNTIQKNVKISGAIIRPGSYELKDDENLSKLIQFSNGMNGYADLKNIRLERVLDGTIKMLPISNISQFDSIKAKKGDQVFIREFPFRLVNISGAVINPGTYSMNSGDNILDIIKKAGGYTESAYPFGALYTSEEVKKINGDALQKLYEDSLDSILQLIKNTGTEADFSPMLAILTQLKDLEPNGRVIVDLDKETNNDFTILKNNDKIIIPEKTNQVYIYGSISSPRAIKYVEGATAIDYINKMGSFNKNADKSAIYILYPNGVSINIGVGKNIFANQQAKKIQIYPGSIIYVPEEIDGAYTRRLTSTAYAAILGNIGVTLASLSVLKD